MTNYDKQRQTYRARFMNYLQIIVFKFWIPNVDVGMVNANKIILRMC